MRNIVKKDSNALFLIVISLFIIIFIIVSYIIFSGSLFEDEQVNNFEQKQQDLEPENCEPEVFNIRDNIYSYSEARAVCEAHKSRLATLKELIEAHKKGANWCSYGWSEGQLALYPTQKSFWEKLQNDPLTKNNCGEVGINGGYFENHNFKFGANCYGIKPDQKPNEIEKNPLRMKSQHNNLVSDFKGKLNNIRISPFDENKVTGRWRS